MAVAGHMEERPYAIAIGASTGGVEALLQIAQALPAGLPAWLLVVQHIGPHRSVLPELLRARGVNPAVHPRDGDRPVAGCIHVAPPDMHMLLEEDRIRLVRGPKENHCRPAIDPLFRSVAINSRERAVGVVLTGELDDGTAGLQAIKACGGTAIVQEPDTAQAPSMPRSAVDNVAVDWRLELAEIAPTLSRLVAGPAPAGPPAVPDTLRREQEFVQGGGSMEQLDALGTPSGLTCPECGGGLWELGDRRPLRFRCHTGHAFSAASLIHSQGLNAEHALWSSVRALHEKAALLRRVAQVSRSNGGEAQAQAGLEQADRVQRQAEQLVQLLERRADREGE